MNRYVLTLILWLAALLSTSNAYAADSYRYLHVTIDTPWAIFIFLLFFIVAPFVLMAILYWYFAYKKNKQQNQTSATGGESSSD
jgi:hypothetical protein